MVAARAPPPPSPLPTAAPPSSAEALPSAAALPSAPPPSAAMGVLLEEALQQSFLDDLGLGTSARAGNFEDVLVE